MRLAIMVLSLTTGILMSSAAKADKPEDPQLGTITRTGEYKPPPGKASKFKKPSPAPAAEAPPEEAPPEVETPEVETPPEEASPEVETPPEEAPPEVGKPSKRYDLDNGLTVGLLGGYQWAPYESSVWAVHAAGYLAPQPYLGVGLALSFEVGGGKESDRYSATASVAMRARLYKHLWLNFETGVYVRGQNPDDGRLGNGPGVDKEEIGAAGMEIALGLTAYTGKWAFFRLDVIDLKMDIEGATIAGERSEKSNSVFAGSRMGFGIYLP